MSTAQIVQVVTQLADPTLVTAAVTAVAGLAARSLVLLNRRTKNTLVKEAILTFVKGAAQKIPDTTEGRKALVEEAIKAEGLKVNPNTADLYIEAMVTEFKKELGEASNAPSIQVPTAPVVSAEPPEPVSDAPVVEQPLDAPVQPAPIPAPVYQPGQQLYVKDEAGNLVAVPGHLAS